MTGELCCDVSAGGFVGQNRRRGGNFEAIYLRRLGPRSLCSSSGRLSCCPPVASGSSVALWSAALRFLVARLCLGTPCLMPVVDVPRRRQPRAQAARFETHIAMATSNQIAIETAGSWCMHSANYRRASCILWRAEELWVRRCGRSCFASRPRPCRRAG